MEKLKNSKDAISTIAAILHKRDTNLSSIDSAKFINSVTNIWMGPLHEATGACSDMFQRLVKACCFSVDGLSLPMWAHYAEAHAGFCIEYTLDSLPFLSELKRNLFPVRYHRSRFDATQRVEVYRKKTKNPDFSFELWQDLIEATTYKSTEWSYERE